MDQNFETPDKPIYHQVAQSQPATHKPKYLLFAIPGMVFFLLLLVLLVISSRSPNTPPEQISIEPSPTVTVKNASTLSLENIIDQLGSMDTNAKDHDGPALDLNVTFP